MSSSKTPSIQRVCEIMAQLRAPDGCPWDREQDHQTLRYHAVEEVYELIDAIELEDDHEVREELGDLLLQVIFHCQLASERQAFDFEEVCEQLAAKLIRRHPHVFGDQKVKDVAGVWTQWEAIKKEEKAGTASERHSALDGIPRHLPALHYAEKLAKKARKLPCLKDSLPSQPLPATPEAFAEALLDQVMSAQQQGWSAENLLREALGRREKKWRERELSAES